jgi:antibiotic biosynthesis monooxygenase (ABM) superfamily enzyme
MKYNDKKNWKKNLNLNIVFYIIIELYNHILTKYIKLLKRIEQ